MPRPRAQTRVPAEPERQHVAPACTDRVPAEVASSCLQGPPRAPRIVDELRVPAESVAMLRVGANIKQPLNSKRTRFENEAKRTRFENEVMNRVPAELTPECSGSSIMSQPREHQKVQFDVGVVATAVLRQSSSSAKGGHWATHGCDPTRVKELLQRCVCDSKQCYTNFRTQKSLQDSLLELLRLFWSLGHAEQDNLVFACFAHGDNCTAIDSGEVACPLSPSSPTRHHYFVLGERLRVDCFARLLGIHKRRLYNGRIGKPDGRTLNVDRPSLKSRSIDFFMLKVWLEHGQTIPEGLVKRGSRLHGKYCHKLKKCESSDESDEPEPVPTSVKLQSLDRELSDWVLSANTGINDLYHMLLTTAGGVDASRLTCRRLPVGWNVSTLYGKYIAEPGDRDDKAMYWWFMKAWKERWSKAFAFTYVNEHPSCDACYEYKLALRECRRRLVADRVSSVLECTRAYQRHLSSISADRSFCDGLRVAASAGSAGEDYLMIFIDGMDQAHWRLPRFPGLRSPHVLSKCKRPTVVVEGVWVVQHGVFFLLGGQGPDARL